MTISLNGEKADAGSATNIAELVEHLQLPPEAVLIEHNGVALHRNEWSERPLVEGDRLEMIRVVAGG